MIDEQEFELHKSIIDWLTQAGIPFIEAITVVSYAIQTDRSIPESYFL